MADEAATEAQPEVLRSHDAWNDYLGTVDQGAMSLLDYMATEASHTCANQTTIASTLSTIAETLTDAIHELRLLRMKIEEYDGSVERLELFMARHFDYPLSQVHMDDVEQLREQIKTLAAQTLADKVAAVAVDPRTVEQLKAMIEHPELHAKLDELADTARQGVADLADMLQQARADERARREQEIAEQRRAAEIEAEAIRQAAAIRASELVAADARGQAAGPPETTDH